MLYPRSPVRLRRGWAVGRAGMRVFAGGARERIEVTAGGDVAGAGGPALLETPYSRITLFEDVYLCVMRRGHPLARGKVTLANCAAAKNLAVRSADRSANLIDHMLASRGLQRRTALIVDQFCVVPAIIANSDFVATVLRRKAQSLGLLERSDLVFRQLPLPPVESILVWHPTMTHHKAHRWMREVLVDSCRAL